jgi:Uma2 family endonuclease
VAVPELSKTSAIQQWPLQGEWTYDNYARLPDNGMRYEVIQGDLYMSTAPRPSHQRAVVKLSTMLQLFVEQHQLGEVYVSPIDVILPDLASPVQPDILFVATWKLNIVKDVFVEGVPNLIIEVLSPGNPLHDRRTKFQLYAQAGVVEYWIVDPAACTIEVYSLRGQAYVPLGKFGREEKAQSELLAGFSVAVSQICTAS